MLLIIISLVSLIIKIKSTVLYMDYNIIYIYMHSNVLLFLKVLIRQYIYSSHDFFKMFL